MSDFSAWTKADLTLSSRVEDLAKRFPDIFGYELTVPKMAVAPGRAEILGNHTDYNQGLTLSCSVPYSLLMVAQQRSDRIVRACSIDMSLKPVEFSIESEKSVLDARKPSADGDAWINYVQGVAWSLFRSQKNIAGFDIVLQSAIPPGSGLSSSAALELATALILSQSKLTDMELIEVCKRAENEYIGVPSGFLDQTTEVLADQTVILIDHLPTGEKPFQYQTFSLPIDSAKFIIGYDPLSKHSLNDGKYLSRKTDCAKVAEAAGVPSLRHLSLEQLETLANSSISGQQINLARHVLNENERVKRSIVAIKQNNLNEFGELLTASGQSAVELYGLAEGTPELTWLLDRANQRSSEWGIIGFRNMGGGFNATTLALVENQNIQKYKAGLSSEYKKEFGREYNFLEFKPSASAAILN